MGKRSRKAGPRRAAAPAEPRRVAEAPAAAAPTLRQRAKTSWEVGAELAPRPGHPGGGPRATGAPGTASSRAMARNGIAGVGARAGRAERPARPEALWGRLPVSEFVVLVGVVMLGFGLSRGEADGSGLLKAGVALIGLAAIEVTAREHFGAFKPHALFLALLADLGLAAALGALGGAETARHPIAVAAYAAIFGVLASTLHRTYNGPRRTAGTRGSR